MKIIDTNLPGVYEVENFLSKDERGFFVKTFHQTQFKQFGLNTDFKESYYSTSFKNVIRGMHFQKPPHEHDKLVYVTHGEILDVVVDLRQDSPTYKKYIAVTLKQASNSIYIPKGCAHGFLTVSEEATVVYNVTTVYNQAADSGIRWDSFGFEWPLSNSPIISNRDLDFQPLNNFESPF